MSLTGGGVTLRAGPKADGINPLVAQTTGRVTEQTGDNTKADSFFDVFVEVDLGGGQKLYNHLPIHVAATTAIGCAPPEVEFRKDPQQPIPLFTDPLGGIPQGQIITVRHFFPPPPPPKIGACCLLSNGCVLDLTEFDCHAIAGGHFMGNGTTSCPHNLDGSCKLGACCRANNVCTLDTTADECIKLGGRYLGDGTTSCAHDADGDCIPTVSEWGLVVMAILVLSAATVVIMRRRAVVRGGS
jgi:hypothetical protein